jgi:hypothetical protein
MPRIELRDAYGTVYGIVTRNVETTLCAWFDEILPHLHEEFLGLECWPDIMVYPHAWRSDMSDADWPINSRWLGQRYRFEARNGLEGCAELVKLRTEIEARIAAESSQ